MRRQWKQKRGSGCERWKLPAGTFTHATADMTERDVTWTVRAERVKTNCMHLQQTDGKKGNKTKPSVKQQMQIASLTMWSTMAQSEGMVKGKGMVNGNDWNPKRRERHDGQSSEGKSSIISDVLPSKHLSRLVDEVRTGKKLLHPGFFRQAAGIACCYGTERGASGHCVTWVDCQGRVRRTRLHVHIRMSILRMCVWVCMLHMCMHATSTTRQDRGLSALQVRPAKKKKKRRERAHREGECMCSVMQEEGPGKQNTLHVAGTGNSREEEGMRWG